MSIPCVLLSASGAFRQQPMKAGTRDESAATGRTHTKILQKNGPSHFDEFDFILTMALLGSGGML